MIAQLNKHVQKENKTSWFDEQRVSKKFYLLFQLNSGDIKTAAFYK